VKRECQPTNHVSEDLWKHRRSPVFSARMRFLPVTGPPSPHAASRARPKPVNALSGIPDQNSRISA
jgi:hypothetical protein